MEKKINIAAIYGKHNTKEFIKKKINEGFTPENWGIKEILCRKNPSVDIQTEILKHIKSPIRITFLSQGDLDSQFPGINHQGILFLKKERSKQFGYLSFDDLIESMKESKRPILILDRIQDTGNLGNIIRTAECFGIMDIVVPERDMAPVNEVVERISSGAVHHVKIYRVLNLSRVLDKLKDIGYWIISSSDSGDEDWSGLPTPMECAIILGNEEKGVRKLIYENSDFKLRIPLRGEISSLNVTVACGIILDRIVNRIKT